MKTLLIDDLRQFKVSKITRSFDEGVQALQEELWDILYLDHDLGDFKDGIERTGYDILCWLETHPEHLPKKIVLVTSNPAGRKRMLQVIDELYLKQGETK